MAGVHRLKHVERLSTPTLADDDAVWAHAQGILEQVALHDLALAFDIGRARFQAHPVTVSLGDVADQVRKVLSNRYGGRVEAVDFQFPSRLPQAWCDSTHLEQALTNLIGNALEHSWATTIVVSARRDGAWLEVTVEDNGRGLAQERVAALFSRSLQFRLPTATRRALTVPV